MQIETRSRENVCGKLTSMCSGCYRGLMRALWGGLVGAASGVIKPVAEWMLNAWEKGSEKNAVFRGRMPVLIDIGAAAVVLYGSYVRFGEPAAYFFAATGSILCAYGALVGIAISLRQNESLDKTTLLIARELWVWKIENNQLQPEKSAVLQNALLTYSSPSRRTSGFKVLESIKGAMSGSVAAALMPFVQLFKTIITAKRKWPLLINTGAINIYAWYVGTVFIGPGTSLLIFAGLEGTLALYGLAKGAYIGYTQSSAIVPTLLWEGGLTCNPSVHPLLERAGIEPSLSAAEVLAFPVVPNEALPQEKIVPLSCNQSQPIGLVGTVTASASSASQRTICAIELDDSKRKELIFSKAAISTKINIVALPNTTAGLKTSIPHPRC